MNKKFFLLILSINVLSGNDQLHKLTPLIPLAARQNSQMVTTGACVSDEMRNVILEAAPADVKKLIKIVKDPNSPTDIRPRRILLYGPSGCGKTTLAQVFAQEVGLPCVFISAGLLGNEYQNSAGSNLIKAIEPHLSKPCIIVLDEIETLLKKAKENKDNTVTQVINILDIVYRHPHVILIGTTNYLKEIEKPIQTRFSADTIQVKREHSPELRKKIFFTHLIGTPHKICDVTLDKLLNSTKHYSVREIESLIRWARAHAYDRNEKIVTESDLQAAYGRLEEGRKAINNEQSWSEFLKSSAKWTGQEVARAGIGAATTAGIYKIIPESFKQNAYEAGIKIINIILKKQ